MGVKKHWSEVLSCHLCGKRFRSMNAEACNRHNAKFLCKDYPKEEAKSIADILIKRIKEVNIIMQALRIAVEDGSIEEHVKQSEIEVLKTKLQNVK